MKALYERRHYMKRGMSRIIAHIGETVYFAPFGSNTKREFESKDCVTVR